MHARILACMLSHLFAHACMCHRPILLEGPSTHISHVSCTILLQGPNFKVTVSRFHIFQNFPDIIRLPCGGYALPPSTLSARIAEVHELADTDAKGAELVPCAD